MFSIIIKFIGEKIFILGYWLMIVHVFKNATKVTVLADWESWWTYEGISGPDFWGRLNPRWSHCSKGQRQSPINIETGDILYDPHLTPIKINGDYVRGQLVNTGRGISFLVADHNSGGSGTGSSGSGDKMVTISSGPFSYQYTLSNITLHFGRENDRGSEHTIDGRRFAGELQLYAYNSQLYSNWSEAKREPNGLAAISIFIMVTAHHHQHQLSSNAVPLSSSEAGNSKNQHHLPSTNINPALKQITGLLKNITKRGLSYTMESLSIMDLLPNHWQHYVTYSGSLTQPACHETVQWVILNHPVYLNAYQFHMLRHSLKGDGHQDNFRPTQPTNKRLIRSNIVHEHLTYQDNNQKKFNKESKMKKKFSHLDTDKKRRRRNTAEMDQEMDLKDVPEFDDKFEEFLANDDHQTRSTYGYYQKTNTNDEIQADDDLVDHSQLLAVKDEQLCLPDQIRLYGYRANPKMIHEEL